LRAAVLCAWCLAAASLTGIAGITGGAREARAATPASAPARIEARSRDLLAVGVLQGETMTIHVSRLLDNAPVRDAVVTVYFRGGSYPTVAQVDGSYSLQARELALPGATAMEFHVTSGGTEDKLTGTLQVAGSGDGSVGSGSVRQLGWWVLNFAVCGAFLWLWARRKKPAEPAEPGESKEP
jgi:hypothetical protein